MEDTITVVAAFADAQRAAMTAALIEGDLELVGRASSTGALLDLTRSELPDVVLLELDGEVDAREAIGTLRAELPVVRVLVVADHLDASSYPLLLAGAAGGLDRSEHTATISSVLTGTARREVVLPSAWAEQMLSDVVAASSDDPFADVLKLTETERDVIERMAQGRTIADIATEFAVTNRLVALHVGYAVAKLQRHAGYVLADASTTSD